MRNLDSNNLWQRFVSGDKDSLTEIYNLYIYAEDGWTNQPNKNFDRFTKALDNLKLYWDNKGILYSYEK